MKQYFKLTSSQKIAKNCLHHQGEIVLLDQVVSCHLNGILAQTTIKEDNAFLIYLNEEKVFPLYQSIELIAQSLGCYQKIYNTNVEGRENKAKIGFLLSARNFELFSPYAKIGQTLLVQVEITTQDESGFGVCEGKIFLDTIDEKNLLCQSSVSVLSPKGNFIDFLEERKNER